MYRTKSNKDGEFNKFPKGETVFPKDRKTSHLFWALVFQPALTSAEQGAEPTAHSAAVRRQRKPLDCAVFCNSRTTDFPFTAIALPITPQASKRAINVFSMALYQAYVINYSPMPIISQVIATLFCPANCRKGGKGEGGRWGRRLLAPSWILHTMESVCSAGSEKGP